MSVSSPATDFEVDCFKSPDGRVWWYFSWMQNGRRRSSYNNYVNRVAAMQALREWRAETGE